MNSVLLGGTPSPRAMLAAGAALVALALTNVPALANGRFPASNALIVMPGKPSTLLLRTTYGLLFSSDQGQNFDWICEKAVGYGGVEDPSLGLTSGGAVLSGTFEGLSVSPDTGCTWGFAGGGLSKQVVIDLVVRPDTPSTALALTSTYAGDGGATLFNSTVYVSQDNGGSWAAEGVPVDPTILTETIEVAPTDPHRIYVSGVRGQGPMATAWLYVSYDDAAHWTPQAIPLDVTEPDAAANETGAYIAGVDPLNADKVYVRTSGQSSSRLLVSSNAGQSFSVAFQGGPMLGFALAPDGSEVYLGGPLDGLQVAPSASLAFSQRSTIQVQCLATSGGTLYACSNEVSGFILGASSDGGMTWQPLLHLSTLRGPLACPPTSQGAACDPNWPALAQQLGVALDGGVPPPSDGGGVPPPTGSSKSGCSCTASRSSVPGALLALVALALGAFGARRRCG